MQQHVSALLVYGELGPLDALREPLQRQSLSVGRARTCNEARHLMEATQPHVVFTDCRLPDGTWADVVRCAETGDVPSNVIVVSAKEDMKLYIKARESGAFDFIMTPFEEAGLNHVVKLAVSNALARRNDTKFFRAAS